jgi:hypothetical protein
MARIAIFHGAVGLVTTVIWTFKENWALKGYEKKKIT